MLTCCVNVRDFGAVGRVLSTTGSITAGSTALIVDTVDGWAVGAGIGIAGAAIGLTPPDAAALVTRVVGIDPLKKTLHLKDPAANTVVHVPVTADDSLPIQEAIDSLGKGGGTVCLPPGTYMIGTTGAITNQPIVLGSNLRIVGAGKGATLLQLCQEANIPWRSGPWLLMAGPIFLNAANYWWSGSKPSTDPHVPYGGLPYDSNIEIADITFDGDKNHQTVVYEADYRPKPTQMPDPTESVFLTGTWDAAGLLPAGQSTYDVFIRFQDASGNEGMGGSTFEPISLGLNSGGLPNNTVLVSLPPVFPSGAVAVVPYIRRADPSTATSPINETDKNTNRRYERLDPISVSVIKPWDGNPDPSHWPTIPIYAHTLFPQGPFDTQGNYRFPGIVNYYGNTGASYFGYFLNVDKLYLRDIEVRNFVSDGFSLQNLNYSQFARIHSHHNGRHGVSIVTDEMEEVDFNDCDFESNPSSGVDMEPIACKSLRWNRCGFLNNGFGVAAEPAAGGCQDLEFDTCLFDGNWRHLQSTGGGPMNFVNLKIKDCRFRNNTGNCVVIGFEGNTEDITGEITGCEFDQANGRGGTATSGSFPGFAPEYDLFAIDVPAILLGGLKTIFRITNNHFKPWAAVQTGADGVVRQFYSSSYMIDISAAAGGHTIQNNHFESNPWDTRPTVALSYAPLYPGPGVTWSRSIKDQGFLFSYLETLSANKISGNIGDGLIWTESQIAGSKDLPCGLDLEEKGSITAIAAGTTSLKVPFVNSLPGSYSPPAGNYLVTAAFNWNAGTWWVTNATPAGFTINWTTAPGASLTPQLNWSAKSGA